MCIQHPNIFYARCQPPAIWGRCNICNKALITYPLTTCVISGCIRERLLRAPPSGITFVVSSHSARAAYSRSNASESHGLYTLL